MSVVELTGRLVCGTEDEARNVVRHLPHHIDLTRAEAGCVHFEVNRAEDPLVWSVSERFVDRDAFEAHQARVGASEWGRATTGIAREYVIRHGEQWYVALGTELVGAQVGEYAFPGPLRDRLVSAIVSGDKTATASLVEDYRRGGEQLPRAGDLEVVLDSDGRPVCVTRNVRVQVERFADVSDDHAVAEGEGCVDAESWRRAHREFWTSPEFVDDVGNPAIAINDDTRVVLVAMEVVAQL